jgi:hypothetical protein
MPLQADDIERFSRQILVTSIGGVGQEKLCQATFGLHGEGAALETARKYLLAGGSRFESRGALGQLSVPGAHTRRGIQVILGQSEGVAVILWTGGTNACFECFHASSHSLSPPLQGAISVVQGALAALVFQRMVLGLGTQPMGAVQLGCDGGISVWPLKRCMQHGVDEFGR